MIHKSDGAVIASNYYMRSIWRRTIDVSTIGANMILGTNETNVFLGLAAEMTWITLAAQWEIIDAENKSQVHVEIRRPEKLCHKMYKVIISARLNLIER